MTEETKKIDAPKIDAPKFAKPYGGGKYEQGEPTLEGEAREAWLRAKKSPAK